MNFNPSIFLKHLPPSLSLKLHTFSSIPSTNEFAFQSLHPEIENHSFGLVIADMQTAGKGRSHKTWVSPQNGNLYMSLYGIVPVSSTRFIPTLSLYAALVTAELLYEAGLHDVKIKWPNDILYANAKLCGILMQSIVYEKTRVGIVVGVGVNFLPCDDEKLIQERAITSLSAHLPSLPQKEIWVANWIQRFLSELQNVLNEGFPFFKERFLKLDYLFLKNISYQKENHIIPGKIIGYDVDGALCVQHHPHDQITRLYESDVSLKVIP